MTVNPNAEAVRRICYDGWELSTQTPKANVEQFLSFVQPWINSCVLSETEYAQIGYYYAYALMLAGRPVDMIHSVAKTVQNITHRNHMWFINVMVSSLLIWIADPNTDRATQAGQLLMRATRSLNAMNPNDAERIRGLKTVRFMLDHFHGK